MAQMPAVWPIYDAGTPDHAHALGVLSINYNNLEWILLMFHLFYSGTPHPAMSLIFEKLPTDGRLDLLKKIIESNAKEPAINRNITDFIAGYKICTHNRNTLLHSQVISSRGVNADDNILTTTKRSKKSGGLNSYEFTLAEIRQAADEIYAWYIFGNVTLAYAFQKSHRLPGWQHALPDKPPLPVILNPKSPPTDNSSAQPRS